MADGCSSCRGQCPAPQACQVPERARQFTPSYGIAGPYRRPPLLARIRAGLSRLFNR